MIGVTVEILNGRNKSENLSNLEGGVLVPVCGYFIYKRMYKLIGT